MKATRNGSRPAVDKRTFVSEEIEKYIKEVTSKIKDVDIANIFTNCYFFLRVWFTNHAWIVLWYLVCR